MTLIPWFFFDTITVKIIIIIIKNIITHQKPNTENTASPLFFLPLPLSEELSVRQFSSWEEARQDH
jgi:hypothetical protein